MAEPAAVDGVSELVLEVSDLERAERFYTETLGLPVVERWPHRDAVWVLAGRHPHRAVEAAGRPRGQPRRRARPLRDAAAASRSSTRAWRRCAAHGHEVPVHEFGPLADGAPRTRAAYVHDPDGHLVEFWTADMRDYRA